ncbi:colicin E5-related ribonuclease, partial [Thiolapillus sp.]
FANGALSGAFGYLFNQLKGEWCLSASCHGTSYGELEFMPEEEQVDLANTVLLEAVTTVGTGGTIQVIRGVKALKAAKWILGKGKSATKWANQMKKRGWTNQQITEALQGGKRFPAENLVNKGNSATRYVHPKMGRSVVIDDVTKEIIHVGGDGFKY